MTIELKPEHEAYVQAQVRAGRFKSADEALDAAVHFLRKADEPFGDFEPGELDALLAEGLRDIERGDVYDGEEVMAELRARFGVDGAR